MTVIQMQVSQTLMYHSQTLFMKTELKVMVK